MKNIRLFHSGTVCIPTGTRRELLPSAEDRAFLLAGDDQPGSVVEPNGKKCLFFRVPHFWREKSETVNVLRHIAVRIFPRSQEDLGDISNVGTI